MNIKHLSYCLGCPDSPCIVINLDEDEHRHAVASCTNLQESWTHITIEDGDGSALSNAIQKLIDAYGVE